MIPFSASDFVGEHARDSILVSDFGEVSVRLHWTDKPYRWHTNTGPEVFVVLDGQVDMHVRTEAGEHIVHLAAGQGVSVEPGDQHVAHPVGAARILVVERKDSE